MVHSLPSSQLSEEPGWQLPPWHASPIVHWLPSLHVVPSALECVQPVAATQESVVQTLPSSQSGAVPDLQMVPEQVSRPLQALPSEHDVPTGTGGYSHCPVAEHVSCEHGSPSSQIVQAWPALPHADVEVPLTHVEPFQQPAQHAPPQHRPLRHGLPSLLATLPQVPVASQLSTVHSFESPQFTHATPPVPHVDAVDVVMQLDPSQHPVQHAPPWHVPPVHAVLSAASDWVHCPLEQPPTLHSTVVVQSTQIWPAAPHAATSSPGLQTEKGAMASVRQAEQQTPLPLQVPLPAPSSHTVPWVRLRAVQKVPLTQAPYVQSLPVPLQSWQSSPPPPQA